MEQACIYSIYEKSAIRGDSSKRCGTGYAKDPLGLPYPMPLRSLLGRQNVPTRDTKLALCEGAGNEGRMGPARYQDHSD